MGLEAATASHHSPLCEKYKTFCDFLPEFILKIIDVSSPVRTLFSGCRRLIGRQAKKKLIFYNHSRPSTGMFTLYVFVNVSNARFPSSGNFRWKSGLCSFLLL